MIIGDKFVFIHNPRTGGAFVRRVLKEIFPASYFSILRDYHKPIDSLNKEDFKKFKFGVIRNPWEWYVSLYHFLQKNGLWLRITNSIDKKNTFKHFLSVFLSDDFIKKHKNDKFHPVGNPHKERTVPVFDYMYNLDIGFFSYRYIYMFFKNYEDIIYNNKNFIFNDHDNLLSLDCVLRNESLSQDLIRLFDENKFCNKKLALKDNKYFKKVNSSSHKHYSKYYDNELIDIVRYKDRLIIKEYNYKFDEK